MLKLDPYQVQNLRVKSGAFPWVLNHAFPGHFWHAHLSPRRLGVNTKLVPIFTQFKMYLLSGITHLLIYVSCNERLNGIFAETLLDEHKLGMLSPIFPQALAWSHVVVVAIGIETMQRIRIYISGWYPDVHDITCDAQLRPEIRCQQNLGLQSTNSDLFLYGCSGIEVGNCTNHSPNDRHAHGISWQDCWIAAFGPRSTQSYIMTLTSCQWATQSPWSVWRPYDLLQLESMPYNLCFRIMNYVTM